MYLVSLGMRFQQTDRYHCPGVLSPGLISAMFEIMASLSVVGICTVWVLIFEDVFQAQNNYLGIWIDEPCFNLSKTETDSTCFNDI